MRGAVGIMINKLRILTTTTEVIAIVIMMIMITHQLKKDYRTIRTIRPNHENNDVQ